MKRYIKHIRSKEPHERRRHALQLSGVIVGLFFVAWVATFSARLGAPPAQNTGDTAQTASAANATMLDQAQLQVSTSSVYSY